MKQLKSSPKDFFYYLLMMVTFYISIVSLIILVFQYIDISFPDQLDLYLAGNFSAIRGATAALIVSWPVYILMAWLINRDIKKEKQKLELKPRKWLLYLTLFIAAIVIIIDLITLLNNFLGGELTSRFFLKTVFVLVVTASIFGYYLFDLKREAKLKKPIILWSAISSSILVVGFIVAGFFIAGTPQEQRMIRFDEQRVYDLQDIQSQVIDYYRRKEVLPSTLAELEEGGAIIPTDPQTGESYEYEAERLKYKLCATFETSSTELDGRRITRPVFSPYVGNLNFDHEVGETCFSREIDPALIKEPELKEPLPVEAVGI